MTFGTPSRPILDADYEARRSPRRAFHIRERHQPGSSLDRPAPKRNAYEVARAAGIALFDRPRSAAEIAGMPA